MVAWLLVQGAGADMPLAASVCDLGLIPGELTASRRRPARAFPMGEGVACLTDPGRQISNVITSMFLHGSWMHLLGNMWFLWLFGNNIEDSMTRPRFVVFYLVCGLAAALAQVVGEPGVGDADGRRLRRDQRRHGRLPRAVSARARVHMVPLGFILQSMALPAWAMLIYWAFLQFAGGVTSIGRRAAAASRSGRTWADSSPASFW